MARIKGLKALFGAKQVQSVIEDFQEKKNAQIFETMQFLGEEFVNKARLGGNYQDRTGNLRSSVGYIILYNGRTVDSNFEGNSDGKSKGSSVANEVALQYPRGYVLIGVAGMEYAAYVEAKNFDVISGSAPGSQDIKSILNEIKS